LAVLLATGFGGYISKQKFTVLGIDPGSQFTGFGAVRTDGEQVELVSCGVIAPPSKLKFNERIGIIASELEILFEKLAPQVIVIERVFLGKNADSAFKLGHARGVAVAAAVRSGADVAEYAARAVKKGITGSGASSKEQVQTVLFAALRLKGRMQADASDALALAFYHARNLEVLRAIQQQEAQP
jgi:crossover junction endodeoxyribonuclease RuvC